MTTGLSQPISKSELRRRGLETIGYGGGKCIPSTFGLKKINDWFAVLRGTIRKTLEHCFKTIL